MGNKPTKKPMVIEKWPDLEWENQLLENQVCKPFYLPPSTLEPVRPDYVRFVCISDTHSQFDEVLSKIPPGDVLVHCGDFTNFGEADEVEKFDLEMAGLPHKHKIVIAGNHELGFEDGEDLDSRNYHTFGRGLSRGYELLKNCTYLQDSSVTVCGLKIYGSSWHSTRGYSFYKTPGQAIWEQWNKIPADVDVLLTHTPPYGHLDLSQGRHFGCVDLLNAVEQRVKPKFHVFGHIHDQNGCTTNDGTVFINASICTNMVEPENNPIVFDLKLPQGFQK